MPVKHDTCVSNSVSATQCQLVLDTHAHVWHTAESRERACTDAAVSEMKALRLILCHPVTSYPCNAIWSAADSWKCIAEPRERDRIDAEPAERGERRGRPPVAEEDHTGVIKMRGLPFSTTAEEIVDWYRDAAPAITTDRQESCAMAQQATSVL